MTARRWVKKNEHWRRMLYLQILFNVYRECLIKKSLEVVGDFKKEQNLILTVKYADDLVLLAKEGTLLQGAIATGRDCYRAWLLKYFGIWNKCEKNKGNGNLEATRPSGHYDRSKPEENKEYFDFLVNMITNVE